MALLRAASALPAEEAPAWLPTHVQVTVLRARGLRCKGGGGGGRAATSDAYAVLELGREKYRTAVAEKSAGEAEWREQCALELPAAPAARRLRLTVLHRALLGADRFLGRAEVPLQPARAPDTRWHKLHSKPGKKEKERGEIEVSIQFTRHNLSASMFDLSMKEKPRSPFGKLKDKVKGKKTYDLESASAIIPSSIGALDEDDDDDFGGKKSKVKGFFLRNKLRKSSLTQSNTSLGSDSTISSASLGMAGSVPEGTRSPSRHGSLSMERSGQDLPPSTTHRRALSDAGAEPVSRSSLCINGSHVYSGEAAPRSPRRPHDGFGFAPLHADPREGPWAGGSFSRAQHRDEPRFIPSPPSLALQEELKVSTKAVTLSNHLGRARMEESSRAGGKPAPAAAPTGCPAEGTQGKPDEEVRKEERKDKGSLSHHGGGGSDAGSKGQGEKAGASHGASVPAAAGDEQKKPSSRFGSKEPQEPPQKRSLQVSPQAETSSEGPSRAASRSPARSPPARLLGANPAAAPAESPSGCLSPTNPFLSSLQSNPFLEDLLAEQLLNSPSPAHFFSSFPPGPHASTEVTGSFYSAEDPSASLSVTDPERESAAQSVGVPVPETTPPAQGELAAPDEDPAAPAARSEWDDTFDAFASSRLKPEARKEPTLEPMAFLDEASAMERPGAQAGEDGSEAFGKAPVIREVPPSLRSWAPYSGLDVGANLVSTTQEATVIEDVLSPVSAGSLGRRKSSTPAVWAPIFASGNAGEKGASTQQAAENIAREEGDSNEEELPSAGENGWMTIATETAPEPAANAFERERRAPASVFGQRPFLSEGPSEEPSGSRAACALPRSGLRAANPSEAPAGSNVAAVPPRVLAEPARALRGAGSPGPLHGRPSLQRPQGSDGGAAAAPPPKPPRQFAAAGGLGEGDDDDVPEEPEAAPTLPGAPRSHEDSVPAAPGLGMGAGSEFPLCGEAGSAAEELAARSEPEERGSAAGEQPLESSGLDAAEFETCPSRFSLDALAEPSPAAGSLPERLLPAGLSPAPEADSGRAETFWTALEEPEAAARAPPGSAGRAADFKKADFWQADGAEAVSARNALAPGNPFAAALSPSAPTNPFVERPPDAPPVHAVRPGRGGLREEAPPPAAQAANAPREQPPSPHASQPLASSSPFPVAAANPEHSGFPARRGVPAAAAGLAAAQPCPGDSPASALLVLPRETQPAGKALVQQTSSPHAVRPLSPTSAPSSGPEKQRTAATSSVQPLASVSHLEKTDSKKIKDATVPDQSAKYYHLTHDELIQLLLQREKELSKKEEHIRELENYIDQLLVRIMEHSPTLLQIPLGEGETQ